MIVAFLVDPVRRFGLRRLRLATGLTLFTYVGLHLANHALGNISLEAMEAGLLLQKLVWQGWIGAFLLYSALTIHFGLGLYAFYERRHYGWTIGEVVQLTLGLTIPLLLINHLTVTRIALTLYGLEKGYTQELYSFRVQSLFWGWVQVAMLIVAWSHGCIGVYFWLRLKSFFRSLEPLLATLAVLLPVLALLGYFQGGRRVFAAAQDPAWRAINLTPDHVGTVVETLWLTVIRDGFLWCYGATLLAILAARGFRSLLERRRRSVRIAYPYGRSIRVPVGSSVLEASLRAGFPHVHVCGGRGRCSTCRIRIIGSERYLPSPGPQEQAVLERIGAIPGIRLACQLRPPVDIAVAPLLPPQMAAARAIAAGGPSRSGEERFIVVLVVDMRDSTRLGARHLPFDTVFIIDRFIESVARAVASSGGRPSQFTGDGMLAIFGIEQPPERACAQAIEAVAAIGAAVQALNQLLADDLDQPIRFGIGVFGGIAVVGEVGYATSRIFTALGDPPNLASRLEGLCKELWVEAVISDEVCRTSRLDLAALPLRMVELRGHDRPIGVRLVEVAIDLPLDRISLRENF